jgi:hypothetical protein
MIYKTLHRKLKIGQHTYISSAGAGGQKPTVNMLTRSFILKFSYINDILSLNNSKYGDFVDRIYPIDLEIGA